MSENKDTATLLSTHGLCVGYGHKTLAGDMDLELHRGDMVALLGVNGRGKSTLLRTLAGSLPPLAGQVCIMGEKLPDIPPRELARRMSIVCTDRTQAELTVRELVGIGRQPYTGFFGGLSRRDNEVIDQCVAKVGIQELENRKITTLSDGERQKAMIARALAQETPLILLDEPTSFLDAASRLETMRLLGQLAKQGKGILLSTHDVAEALEVATHGWLLTDRMESGPIDQLIADGAMDRLFPGRGVAFDKAARNFTMA